MNHIILLFHFLLGWFPAKFVQLLDERSKQYTSAGDDSVWETVTDLVRGFLGPAFKRVLEHGMRRPNFLGRLLVIFSLCIYFTLSFFFLLIELLFQFIYLKILKVKNLTIMNYLYNRWTMSPMAIHRRSSFSRSRA